jgi:gamma-glutamyltranspeptidase/glutathione hydrolase
MLLRRANGRVFVVDGREMAPLLAGSDLFLRGGRADPNLSQLGALSVATPGALMAYNYAAANFGKLPLRDHLVRAATLAEAGFPLDAAYAQRLAESARELSQFPDARTLFFHADNSPLRAGEVLRQPDLARTYRGIAQNGAAYFYNGPFAIAAVRWMATHGGILNEVDLAYYRIALREPVVTSYRGRSILGFPPPSSGGVGVAEILNILENFDLKKMGPGSADLIHVVAEAMKLAFADRAFWLGDPDHIKVPRGLNSKLYAAQLAKRIRLDRATPVPQHSVPPAPYQNYFGSHTTHFSTADAAGNWVSCTATLNTAFGSKVIIPGTGVLMNNQMDDFSAQPGMPNYFGLIGGDANAVGPGRRPLTSMSPTFVMARNQPILAVGAAGGPSIISQVVLTTVNMIDFGMDLETALAQPRFHHQWSPDELRLETRVADAVQQELEKRGHRVVLVEAIGAAHAVGRTTDGKELVGVSEPRGYGKAEGW